MADLQRQVAHLRATHAEEVVRLRREHEAALAHALVGAAATPTPTGSSSDPVSLQVKRLSEALNAVEARLASREAEFAAVQRRAVSLVEFDAHMERLKYERLLKEKDTQLDVMRAELDGIIEALQSVHSGQAPTRV